MANRKIKVGVIGTGVLGRFHTKLYKENPAVELMGVFDVFPAAAEKIAQEFGTKAYASAAGLAADCDALSIAVPATLHYETAMPLIAMGKHLLMEKPLAATVEQARELVAAAEEKKIVFGVGHVERFNAAMDFIRENQSDILFIEAKRMAKYPPPRPGMHRRGTEVSVVLDLMIHDLDLILSLVNSDVEKIDALGMPALSETEDIANVRIKFKNGVVANVTASRISTDPIRQVRVVQKDACMTMDFGKGAGTIVRRSIFGFGTKNVVLPQKNALAEEQSDFIQAVLKTRTGNQVYQPRVSGLQGLRALELAVAITEEIRRYNQQYGFNGFMEQQCSIN